MFFNAKLIIIILHLVEEIQINTITFNVKHSLYVTAFSVGATLLF